VRKTKKAKERVKALDNLSFSIDAGEIYGIIGPNGAGKTTLIKILSTLVLPDYGNASIMGFDVVSQEREVKPRIGVSVGEFTRTLYWRLTGRENLVFFARLKDVDDPLGRSAELLDFFGLNESADQKVMEYSMGMKHKLSIAQALLTDPDVLLLDEPLTGIDPITAYDIKSLIKEKMAEKTIIWTTHNLYEVEEMCDRVAIINRGVKILEGKPDELRRRFWGYEKLIISTPQPERFAHLDGAELGKDKVVVKTGDVSRVMIEIGRVVAEGASIIDIQTVKPSLEEIFMQAVAQGGGPDGK
jgi:ABC-2 type transport system ATP-binding protein